ncbi:MAG: hypothetical protein ABH851_09510 [Methanobacteriota archaeon]
MDKIFTYFMGFVLIVAAGIYFFGSNPSQIIDARPDQGENTSNSTTLTETPTTSTSTILPEKVSSTSTSTLTATTTLPKYVELNISSVSRCRTTILGKLVTIVAELSDDVMTGDWGPEPDPKVYFTCDGSELQSFDWVLFAGGRSIEPFDDLSGMYRLAAKCGRNLAVEDVNECENLTILLDTYSVNASTIGKSDVDRETISYSTSTTTVARENPYLNRFKGQGYHKVDVKVSWLCPTCVPAVNRIVIEEPGVKSRSIAYKQDLNYVIYDPKVVSLDRVLTLLNAGGTVTLIEDYEI